MGGIGPALGAFDFKAAAFAQPRNLPVVITEFHILQPGTAVFIGTNLELIHTIPVDLDHLSGAVLTERHGGIADRLHLNLVNGIHNGIGNLRRVVHPGIRAAGLLRDLGEIVRRRITGAGADRIHRNGAVFSITEHPMVGVFHIDRQIRVIQRGDHLIKGIFGIRFRIQRRGITQHNDNLLGSRIPIQLHRLHERGIHCLRVIAAIAEGQSIDRPGDGIRVIRKFQLDPCRIILIAAGTIRKIPVIDQCHAVARALFRELGQDFAHIFLGVIDIVLHRTGGIHYKAQIQTTIGLVVDHRGDRFLFGLQPADDRFLRIDQTAAAILVIKPAGC